MKIYKKINRKYSTVFLFGFNIKWDNIYGGNISEEKKKKNISHFLIRADLQINNTINIVGSK